MLFVPSRGGSAAAALPAAVQQDPGCMQDSWELAAWKTSSHSLRRLPSQQQQVSVSDLVVAVDSGQFSTSSSAGGTLAGKALTSHDLILHGTGASTSQAVLAVNKVSLGVCIGAGAFEIACGMQRVRLHRACRAIFAAQVASSVQPATSCHSLWPSH